MGTDQIMCCIVALILGMLMANMLKNVCGCKTVEGLDGGTKNEGSKGGTQCKGPANPNNCFEKKGEACQAKEKYGNPPVWPKSCCSDGKVVDSKGDAAKCSDITDSFECQHSDPDGNPENLWNYQEVDGVKQSCQWFKKKGISIHGGECKAVGSDSCQF